MVIYESVLSFLVSSIGASGYFGIFVFMFLESSFFLFPSEIVIIPAGYLAYQGEMSLVLIVLVGVLGSLAGAWLNYFLAYRYGRKIVLKFLKRRKLVMIEGFFKKHGPISTFNGRLIPVVRQYISFPAGLAKMNILEFTFYTGLGSGIWIIVLVLLGYFLGQNDALVSKYLSGITGLVLVFIFIFTAIYVWVKKGNVFGKVYK